MPTNVPDLDLIPSTMALATLDRSLGHQEGMGLILTKALSLLEDQLYKLKPYIDKETKIIAAATAIKIIPSNPIFIMFF